MNSYWISNLTHVPAVLQSINMMRDSIRAAPRSSNYPAQREWQVWVLSGRRIFPRLYSEDAPPGEAKLPRVLLYSFLCRNLLLVGFNHGACSEHCVSTGVRRVNLSCFPPGCISPRGSFKKKKIPSSFLEFPPPGGCAFRTKAIPPGGETEGITVCASCCRAETSSCQRVADAWVGSAQLLS